MEVTLINPMVIISSILIARDAAASRCFVPTPLSLQLVMEYARWRTWDQLVIFDNSNSSSCQRSYARSLLSCFGDKGIKISMQRSMNERLSDTLSRILLIRRHRLGIVVFTDGLNLTSPDNVLQLASQKQLFNYYTSWLIVASKRHDAIIDAVLRLLNIGIDSDVVVATSPFSSRQAAEATFLFLNRTCAGFQIRGMNDRSTKFPRVKYRENVTVNLDYVGITEENRTISFFLAHVYKIRTSENSSLIVDVLGSWNPGSYVLKFPVSVELRNNFQGFPLLVGVLNSTSDSQSDAFDEEEVNDISPLIDIMTFVVSGINASIELVPHEKLGTLTNKAWSHLLGDVTSGVVDIGLGNINKNAERQREMSFTHPIIQSMRNIYFRPPESGLMRDIFLQPFNNRLLGCVAATCMLIVFAMGAINYGREASSSEKTEGCRGLGEAVLVCISIMCMQGSSFSPRSLSAKMALLVSLIFALVIYNAYAGFITSILSVQAAGIRSLADLHFYNYKLGYSVNDDEYIRNANDSNLRQLYIKAFNGREARLDTNSGLQKAAKGGYGFFVSARLGRRALRTSLLHNRCLLKELIVPQTLTVIALPMAHTCPYKKIINHRVMRIGELGVMSRIGERMLPRMPQCEAPTTFHSARLADVYSAFVILLTGLTTGVAIGILERIWSKRTILREKLKRAIETRSRRKFDDTIVRPPSEMLEKIATTSIRSSRIKTGLDRSDSIKNCDSDRKITERFDNFNRSFPMAGRNQENTEESEVTAKTNRNILPYRD